MSVAFVRLKVWWPARVALMAGILSAVCRGEPSGLHGVVSTANPVATEAGLDVLKHGGNAIDAAVAVGLTLGVVDPQNSGIGGGCFMLIHLAGGTNVCLDGRETAPAAATATMFVREGKADTSLSQTGALASGVPGELAAFDSALKRYGSKAMSELILPAAETADSGFKVSAGCAAAMNGSAEALARFPGAAALYLLDGRGLKAGTVLRLPDLARTYRSIAVRGIEWFYRGPFARTVEAWMKSNGGVMTARDFAAYQVQLREPIQSSYRGFDVICFPPPSSGGVHVLEMLNILENFDLKAMDQSTRLHLEAETMKLAFADRAFWLGDPDYARVPRGLIAKTYAAGLAKGINLEHATKVESHGTPPEWQTDVFKKHTTHFCTADSAGNWVSCTATINTSFGSKVVIPGTGVVMNNEMDDFSIQPGIPNAFRLVGGEANAVAPGKRPLSSMSPTMVFKGGHPVLELGAAGGPRIISAVLQELVNVLDLGMSPAEALAAPRIHQQWSPDELMVEKKLPDDLKAALSGRGHKLSEVEALATSQIAGLAPDGKTLVGAADPRGGGSAAGW